MFIWQRVGTSNTYLLVQLPLGERIATVVVSGKKAAKILPKFTVLEVK